MIVLDANVLVAFFQPNDAHHQGARRLLRDLAEDSRVMHAMTLAEVLVGAVRIGQGDAARSDLRAMGIGISTDDEHAPLRLARLRVDTRLRLPDCCVLDTALQEGAALASFDQRLVSVARSMGIEVVSTPA